MIKDKLKEIRERTGMNKKEFAEYIGTKYTTYNNYETGTREPDSDFFIMISKKFNVSTDFILGLQEEKEILHSYELKSSEYEHIKKYRTLDPTGKSHVDTVLDWEAARSADILQKDARITDLETELANVTPDPAALLNAAHERTDIPITEEMKQADDDIMNDENF